jgi:hypothetical protein
MRESTSAASEWICIGIENHRPIGYHPPSPDRESGELKHKDVIMPKTKRARSNGHSNGESQHINRIPRDNDTGVENLDKVRDILFGSQLRDNERRFGRLEEQVAKETGEVRDEVRKRLESLEAFVRKEVQSIIDRVKNEQSQRTESLRELAQELKETVKSFQQRATELQDQSTETHREIRQEIQVQGKSLRDELSAARLEAVAQMQQSADELQSQKLDKAAMIDLFTEMAGRLSAE